MVLNEFLEEKCPGSDDLFKQLIEAHGLGLPEQYMVAIDALYDKSAVTAEPVIYLCEQGIGIQTDQKIPEHRRGRQLSLRPKGPNALINDRNRARNRKAVVSQQIVADPLVFNQCFPC